MGRGFRKQRNTLKKQYLKPLQDYCRKLEQENETLKNDPNTAIGQIIPQFRELLSQNKRLSVLAAAFIKAQGGTIKVSREDMDSFQGFALSIKWELPEGVEKVEEAKEFIFSYETTKQEPETSEATPEVTTQLTEQAASVEATPEVQEVPETQEEVTPCPGIDLGDGNFSGCSGGTDCPTCGGN